MENKSVKAGTLLMREGSTVDNIWYISSGQVVADCGSFKITLKKGDFIGLADFNNQVHSFNYTATETTQLINLCSRDALLQTNFFAAKPENSRAIAISLNRFVREAYIALNSLCNRLTAMHSFTTKMYSTYLENCRELHLEPKKNMLLEELGDPISMGYSQKCMFQYHKGYSAQLANKDEAQQMIRNLLVPGYMFHASSDMNEVINSIEYISSIIEDCNNILINEEEDDLLAYVCDLYLKAGEEHSMNAVLMEEMQAICSEACEVPEELRQKRIANLERISSAALHVSDGITTNDTVERKLINSMDQIMEYADFDEAKAKEFKRLVNEYKNLIDPSSTDDEARVLRRDIETYFYQLYLAVLEASIENYETPILAKMFLNFGYLDEEIAGMQNAIDLYDLAQTFKGDPSNGIFTGYEWLVAIFTRDREPSINEFDQTYEQFIKEMADNGRIPADQYKLYVENRGQMVMFELQNMFRHASKICSGRILNFCPIFSENQILRSPKEDLLDAHTVKEGINAIKNIDYTLFYRDTVCVFNKKENIYDRVHIEIMPDIVLLPVVGSRGSMWQEFSGRDKMTAARMMLPVFDIEALEKALLRIFAEYRWEMCKREQGARWNDVTEPSLTSLYYDFLQFYRKNSAISTEQKEKIKLGLQRNRNSYKEFFISDYSEYIRFEANGSPHLVRGARAILYSQCPFGSAIRNKLSSNPIYSDLNDRYKITAAQNVHRLENIKKKLTSKGLSIPKELEREIEFYSI